MKIAVRDLKRGDVIAVGDVKFTVEEVVNFPNGKTFIQFRDVPTTDENMAAYGALLKFAKDQMEKDRKEKDNEQEEV